MGQIIKIPSPIDVDNLATIDEVNQLITDGNFAAKTSENTFTKKQIIEGTSSDGSTNIVEYKNLAGSIVAKVDTNGFKEIRYRDEYVGGVWLNAAGAAAPDLVQYTIGGVGMSLYSFDGNNTEERISNIFEQAHDVAIDELNALTEFIEAHIHLMPSSNSAGTVEMFLDFCYAGVGTSPTAKTSLKASYVIPTNSQYKHFIVSFKDALNNARLPKPAAGFEIGNLMLFTLRRTPSGTGDTYPDDIILLKAALHVPTNDFGSRQIYIK